MKAFILLIYLALLTGHLFAAELTGKDIMLKVDQRAIPKDMKSRMTMNLINKNGQVRSREVTAFRQGDKKQIMWFLAPADIKGTSFLRVEHDNDTEDMWLYLPAFKKTRRIVSSAKKENFMGSDFTYEDMSTRKFKDYTYIRRLPDDMIASYNCYIVESIPKEDVDITYSRIISWVWQEDNLPIIEQFYDKIGNLKKVKTLSALKKQKQYWMPGKFEMHDVQKEHKTELVFEEVKVDTGIPDAYFSTRYLRRIIK
ncbi:outer membrane lipoprotein-sorting protein [Candidatus Margulisiibacteriota bacterium]